MLSPFRFVRQRVTGATPLMGFLFATLVLAGWLGYQALDAAASQRRTAESVLRDYAGIAATELARVGRSSIDDVLDEVFSPVSRRLRGRRIPSAEMVGWDMDDAMREERCACPDFRSPIAVFRADLAGNRIEVSPDTLPAPVDDRILEFARTRAPGFTRSHHGLEVLAAGAIVEEPVALGFMVTEDQDGVPDGMYGFVVRASALGELFREWYERRRLLPQPVAGEQPNDSILFVTVRGGEGTSIFASPIAYPVELSARSPLGPPFGDLEVEASVRPDAASQLVIGGLPGSKLPFLALLLVLTLGIGAAAVVQLRREEEFQRLREDFVSGVSHELRTPLAQIRMFAELQESGKLPTEPDRVRAVNVIHRESRRLTHLVENILQFSRLRRTNGRGMPMERLDLADSLADGIDAVTPLARYREVRVEVEADPGVPVVASRDALTRVLVNLLDNALKYGPSGQTIRVGVARVDGSARLVVSDQGPGVPAPDRQRIWKAYRRLERDAKARRPGTGIGLSVVAELIELHGGRTWVEDAEGGGARFVVELPLAEDEDAPAPGEDGASEGDGAGGMDGAPGARAEGMPGVGAPGRVARVSRGAWPGS